MEYYVYIIIVFAVVLKLGFYLCWYQSRRQRGENTTQMRVVMPDGSIRVMTVASGVRGSGQPVTGDTLYQYDNPIIVDSNGVVHPNTASPGRHEPTGQLPRPPSYTGQPKTKDDPLGAPPSYSSIFSQAASTTQTNTLPNENVNNTSPAVLPTVSYPPTNSGFIATEDISPPPYTPIPTDTSPTSQLPADNTTANAETAPSAIITVPPETVTTPTVSVTVPSSQDVTPPQTTNS